MASIWFNHPENHPLLGAAHTYSDLANGSTGVTSFDLSSIPEKSTADDLRVFYSLLNSEMAHGVVFLGLPTRNLIIPKEDQPIAYDQTLFTMRFVAESAIPTIKGKSVYTPNKQAAKPAEKPASEEKRTAESEDLSSRYGIGNATFTPVEE